MIAIKMGLLFIVQVFFWKGKIFFLFENNKDENNLFWKGKIFLFIWKYYYYFYAEDLNELKLQKEKSV